MTPLIPRILSMLGAGKLLSSDSVKKGLSKIDPRLKKFFSSAESAGYSAGAAMSFLNNKFTGGKTEPIPGERPDEMAEREMTRQRESPQNIVKNVSGLIPGTLAGGAIGSLGSSMMGDGKQRQQEQAPPQDGLENFLQKNPKLGNFIKQKLEEGHDPQRAASMARSIKALQSDIADLEDEMGQNLENIIAQLSGGYSQQSKPQASSRQQGLKDRVKQHLIKRQNG